MSKVKSIAVIGLGLIGGSILKGLKGKGYKLFGIARREETLNIALKENLISEGSTNIELAVDADIIFVCTPINKVIETIESLSSKVNEQTIITDAAGIKADIVNFVNKSSNPIRFIGGHPMAGTENKGIESSEYNLFDGAKWVLSPSIHSNNDDFEKLSSVIQQLGAKIIISDPDIHDKAVACISHMPLLLSHALFGTVENLSDKEIRELSLLLASSGFRDMTRLAATNPELSKDMIIKNKQNIIESVKIFKDYLCKLEYELKNNEENFLNITGEIASKRKKMYSSDGKNIL